MTDPHNMIICDIPQGNTHDNISDNSNNSDLIYPCYLYDVRKTHGYTYSSKDSIYHYTDRHNFRKFIESKTTESKTTESKTTESKTTESKTTESKTLESKKFKFQERDIRPFLDIAKNELPIDDNKILILEPRKIRNRNHNDYFTYSLEPPINNDRVSDYMNRLICDKQQYQVLRSFLFSSLISYTPSTYIIVKGPENAASQLFAVLSQLDPIVKWGRQSLYCEANVNKITLDEICQARIVLCDIGNRTLRIANPPHDKIYGRPIQYHGIVYQKDAIPTQNLDNKNRTIYLAEVDTEETFTAGEILGWILG